MSGENGARETLTVVEGGLGRRESVLQRKLKLGDMLDLATFTELVKNFVELYKVGIKVFDEHGAKLADIKVGNGDFCGYVFSFSEGRHRQRPTRLGRRPRPAGRLTLRLGLRGHLGASLQLGLGLRRRLPAESTHRLEGLDRRRWLLGESGGRDREERRQHESGAAHRRNLRVQNSPHEGTPYSTSG